jgi:hypothetical protein
MKKIFITVFYFFTLSSPVHSEEFLLNCNFLKKNKPSFFEFNLKDNTVITPYAEDYKYTIEYNDKYIYFNVELVDKNNVDIQITLATVVNRYTGEIIIRNYNLNKSQQEKIIKDTSQKILDGKKNLKLIKELQESFSQFKPNEVIQGSCQKIKKEKKF